MRLAVLASACLMALSAPSTRADYLNTPGEVARAWERLAPRVPEGAEIVAIVASSDSVAVEWQGAPPRGGIEGVALHAGTDRPKPGERIEALEWLADDPLAQTRTFNLAELPVLVDFDGWLARARAAVKLGSDASFVVLVVGDPEEDIPGGEGLAVVVSLETATRIGHVRMDPARRVIWLQVEESSAPTRSATAPQPVAAAQPEPEPEPEPPAPWRGDSGRDLVAGLAALAAHLGPDTPIWEVDARPDRITIDRPHPTQPRTTAILTLTERGFGTERTFPQMMQTDADLFPLSALAGLTAEAVEAARAAGLAGVALPGGQVARLRIWSGTPFWRHPAGQPFFDIRVEVPPGNLNGYAVVTLGGQLVEAIR